MIQSPQELVARLIDLFPAFASELDDEEYLSLHSVFFDFCPMSAKYLSSSSIRTVKEFCELINSMVAAGGSNENAVSTCFLEHASQIGVRKQIKPYLSPEAKREMH